MQQTGRILPGPEPEYGSIDVSGYYEYIDEYGNRRRMDYVANEGGYQPKGDLPQEPKQIPEYRRLRQEHPELFWAETLSPGGIVYDQQSFQPQEVGQTGRVGQPRQFSQPQDSQLKFSKPKLENDQQKGAQLSLLVL